MRRKFLFSGLALCLLTSGIHAQSSDPEVSSAQAPAVFKSSTNLVQVPVIVRNSAGKPVGNLRAEDFQLFDSGKPQVISRFTVENLVSNEALQSRPGESSETGVRTTGMLPGRFVALLMDDVNTVPEDFPYGRNAALRYIDTLPSDVRVAVYSTSGNTVLDFTGDHERLRKALLDIRATAGDMHYVKVAEGCTLGYYTTDLIVYHNMSQVICSSHQVVDLTAAIVVAEMKHSLDTFADPNELSYFKALRDVIAKMAVLPGQRTVLAISPGQYVPERFQPLMDEVIADAIRAKVVVNGLDSRGVAGSFNTGAERTATNMPGLIELSEQQERTAFMEDLASGTGGIYVHGSNDLDGGIQKTTSVPEYVYVLGFSPSDLHLDGKQHKLRVTLKSSRGLTVQARAGYFAAAYSADPAEEIKRRIEEAFFSSEESNALPARIQTQFFREGNDVTLTVATKVDATKLTFHKEEGRNRDSLTLVVGLFDQNGNSVSAFQKDIQMRLKDETLSAWLKSGIETSTDFHVKPGKYLVRLVVRDSGGSAMAEQSTGVEIPW